MVHHIAEGYHSVTPYLIVDGAARAIDYYKEALGAVEAVRMDGPDGKIAHAEIKIGDSFVMLADETPEEGRPSPKTLGGTTVLLMIYVPDVDAMFLKAIAAGGKQLMPVENQFYGDRSGKILDPFGHVWLISTHVEDVSPEEMDRRVQESMKQQAG